LLKRCGTRLFLSFPLSYLLLVFAIILCPLSHALLVDFFIETDASEQIPDDVELAEKVETEDGSESSGNDAEEATETDDDE
ncbi:hypothetical protein ACSLO3_27915, partial [Escherichia coli]